MNKKKILKNKNHKIIRCLKWILSKWKQWNLKNLPIIITIASLQNNFHYKTSKTKILNTYIVVKMYFLFFLYFIYLLFIIFDNLLIFRNMLLLNIRLRISKILTTVQLNVKWSLQIYHKWKKDFNNQQTLKHM